METRFNIGAKDGQQCSDPTSEIEGVEVEESMIIERGRSKRKARGGNYVTNFSPFAV